MTPASQRWVAAATVLAVNPAAKVRCPELDDGNLIVRDVLAPDAKTIADRVIRCETCGAWNAIRLGPEDRN